MVDKDQKDNPVDEGFDSWLRAAAFEPPKAPEGEWQAIAAAIQTPAGEGQQDQPLAQQGLSEPSLWSFTWPSLVAAAIPLLLLFGGGQNVAPTLASLAASFTSSSGFEQEAAFTAEPDEQLWLVAQGGQGDGLDILMSGDGEPLFLDSP